MAENRARLIGQETEYAICFIPEDGHEHPGNPFLFSLIKEGIQETVPTTNTDRHNWQEQFFVSNGGSFNYEAHPFYKDFGLIEGGTPECSGPEELVLYQRASEAILIKGVRIAEQKAKEKGFVGRLRVLKNCRDAQGNLYGAQENYDLSVHPSMWKSRLGIALGLGVFFIYFTLYMSVGILVASILVFLILATSVLAFFVWLTLLIPSYFSAHLHSFIQRYWDMLGQGIEGFGERAQQGLLYLEMRLGLPMHSLFLLPTCQVLKRYFFQPYRRQILSFICSRIIFSGAGSLLDDGRFVLAEKATGTKRVYRWNIDSEQRPIFDDGNLLKTIVLGLMDLLSRQGNRLRSLFDDVQRFQLGMSDSNMAQFAEYLKVGTTHLILRMAEQGFLVDAPELSDPMTALQKINQDSSLQVSVDIQGGGEWTALSIQQWYWRRAQQFVQESSLCFLEDVEVVRLWGECLDRLSDEPSDLFGRVDWVTKLALLEGAGKGLSYEEKKRIDLQYHELDTGFYADIQKEGLTLSLVEEHAIEEAMNEPSSPEKVQLRAHLIRTLHEKGIDISVNWDSIYIGGWAEREVIDLNRYRKNKSSQTK